MTDFIAALVGASVLVIGGAAIMTRPEPTRGKHCRRSPALLARPIDALEKTPFLCTAEGRVTSHARVRITRQFVCMDCRNPRRDPAPHEGVAP